MRKGSFNEDCGLEVWNVEKQNDGTKNQRDAGGRLECMLEDGGGMILKLNQCNVL